MSNGNDGDRERSGGQQRERQYHAQGQQGQQGQPGQAGDDAQAAGQQEQGGTGTSPLGEGAVWHEPTTGRSGVTATTDDVGAGACGPDDDSDLKEPVRR